jgi:NitT/TauT family transport system permease protein
MRAAEPAAARRRRRRIGGVAVALALAAWQVAGSRGHGPDLIATPTTVLAAGAALAASGELGRHVWVSLQELLGGFALATAAGVALGLAMGWSRPLGHLLDPVVMALHTAPRIALLPVLVVWLGVGIASKVAVVFLGAVFPILVTTAAGVRQVDALWVRAVRAFGARPSQVVATVVVPAALPAILTGLRLGLGRGLIGVIVGEMYVALAGVGQLLQLYGNAGRTPELIALATGVALTGSLAVAGLRGLERWLAPWREELPG